MKCKFCNEEMPERGSFCPICGGDNSVEAEIIIEPEDLVFGEDEMTAEGLVIDGEALPEEAGEMMDEEAFKQEEEMVEEPLEPSPELKRARFISAMTGCVAALAILAVVLFAGISGSFSEDGKGWDVASLFEWIIPRENNLLYKDSYTVSDKKAMKKRETVVATVPGAELTNGVLQIYYWTQVYDFLNNNSYYLGYYGLDYSSPLDTQAAYDRSGTWQQYFLKGALEMWHSNVSFAMLAEQNGYELDAEYRAELDKMRKEMEEQATKNGFASADAMLQDSMGPGCTIDDYISYMETYYMGYSYFAEMYDQIDPTMEEIDAYFEANKEAFAEKKVTKESGYTVDIRHILIAIEKLESEEGDAETQTEDAEGEVPEEELIDGYTQEAWDACLAKANEILDLWLNGEMTEESFAELAKEHSADGNAQDGGIYTGVAKGDMLESYDEWCFDVVRQQGDYGIVRTKHGYHIMYFVGKEDIWITQARSQMISEEAQRIVKEALDACVMDVNYKKIVLGEVDLG